MTVPSAVILSVRRPRYLVYVGGNLLPWPIDISVTRGLDQELASVDITYPYPLPDFVAYWSQIIVLMAVDDPDPTAPYQGMVRRFTGYVSQFNESLWPGAISIHADDIMVIAKYAYTPNEVDLTGETDITAIKRILGPPDVANGQGGCGIRTGLPFEGHGIALTELEDTQLFWQEDQTALQVIQQIDETSMGYRTMQLASGRVVRRFLPTDPNTVGYVWHYQEGVDILEGTSTSEVVSPLNQIQVTGFDIQYELAVPLDQDPWAWYRNSYWIRYLWLRHNGPGQTMLDIQEVTAWILSQLEKRLYRISFSSHLAIFYEGMEVIKVTSPRLKCDQNFWVQTVQEVIDSSGQYTQTITAISELIRDKQRPLVIPPVLPPVLITPGTDVALPLPGPPTPPSNADILVNYAVDNVERELATPASIAGNEGFIYTITFSDQSTSRQGTIVSRAWAATGLGVTVAAGTEPTFTTTYASLDDATISLTVTDSNGSTANLTEPVSIGGVPVNTRKLYSCTDSTYEAFDGTEWRSRAPALGGTVQRVAGGPWWAAGNVVAYSADDLITPPVEVAALPGGEAITAIWKHESTEGDVAVGGSAGSVAISHDKGATWTAVTSPGSAVNFIIVSIHDATEIHVVTPEGWKKSQNAGSTWDLVRAGSFAYLELSHSRNIVVTTAGQLQKGEDGTPFTGNTAPIVAATAHIRQDKFYAIASDGTTWVQTVEGSYSLVPGEPIPAGTPYTAGTYRDGLSVDLIYFAAQDGGLFKTLDGFRTPEGYMRLRTVGLLTP